MNSRRSTALSLLVVAFAVACIDMSAPKGPASISALQLPLLSVVLGDSMRDTNGTAVPLNVVAYDAGGSTITSGVDPQFFIADSILIAHVAAGNYLVGDQIGTLHLLGQIGGLQTPSVVVHVTAAPAQFGRVTDDPVPVLTAPLGRDSSANASLALTVSVTDASGVAIPGFLVRFDLLRAPATSSAAPSAAVKVLEEDGRISSADTTDDAGQAARQLVVVTPWLADSALIAGTKTDTAIVQASMRYHGAPLPGSPIQFIVPIKVGLPH